MSEAASEERPRAVHVEGSPTRCPYCKDELLDLAKIAACAACGARHHMDCHAAHGACATCGAPEVLLPRAVHSRELGSQPPRGSRITVERKGDEVLYSWDRRNARDLFFAIFFTLLVLVAPFGLYLLFQYFKRQRNSLRLLPGTVELLGHGPLGERLVVLRREDVGAVRVNNAQLSIDVGIERIFVQTGVLTPNLTAPELEWLREELEAWKARGA